MSNAINWLLEDENPAIKYRTLVDICDNPPDECTEVYNSIWDDKQILKMLRKQDENGLWDNKDWGVHTSMRYLTAFAEHGLSADKRLDRFVDYTIDFLQSYEIKGDLSGCASPLTLRALVMLGYHGRSEVKELVSKFASTQLYDGGFMCKMKLDKKPERKSCYKAAVAALLLYSECKRKNVLPDNSDKLVNYFLKRDVFYSSDKSNSFKEGKYGWRFIDNFFPVEPMRMGLPTILSALSILGAGSHPALTEARTILLEKKDETGRLSLEGTLTKQPCSFGKVGQINKWVTYYTLLADKYRNGV